jgi:hypothetical protein
MKQNNKICVLCLLCLLVDSGVQHMLCCVFVLFFFSLCTLYCQFLRIVHFGLLRRYFVMGHHYPQANTTNIRRELFYKQLEVKLNRTFQPEIVTGITKECVFCICFSFVLYMYVITYLVFVHNIRHYLPFILTTY